MGAAVATALQESGHPVQAWNRTRRTGPPGVQMLPEPRDAVAGARHVVLCLYDFEACREVLVACGPALETGCLVVNTSTIGPGEALDLERLVRGAGARYLHAPVMGSVPAVRDGGLVVLAGGSRRDVDDARQVLDAVAREIRYVGDPSRAAALKLVAISSLASALVAIRDAIAASRVMGLDLSETLDVLAAGQLGGLTNAKRDRLEGNRGIASADFAAGALLKDVRLLSAALGTTPHVAREIERVMEENGLVAADEDTAALCLATGAGRESQTT
jgi:3-hydroxyisobutyrate dehydrogenase-like beta-hydroxyacid dehydrogenase